MALIPSSFSDPRLLVSAGLVGVVTGLALGSAVAVTGAAPSAGPPAAMRLAIAAEPSLRAPAPDLRQALLSIMQPRPAAVRELECLTEAVYYEARGEPEEGQAAVAQVVINRTQRAGFPKTVCGVVFQRSGPGCQFSFACNTAVTSRRDPAAWRRAEHVASGVLAGHVASEVGRATHYHVAGLQTGWSNGLMQVARIGAHVFYALGRRPALAHTVAVHAAASSEESAPAMRSPEPAEPAPLVATPTAAPSPTASPTTSPAA